MAPAGTGGSRAGESAGNGPLWRGGSPASFGRSGRRPESGTRNGPCREMRHKLSVGIPDTHEPERKPTPGRDLMPQFSCGSLALLSFADGAPSLGGTSGPDLTRYFVVCGGLLLLVAVLGFGFRRLIGRTLTTRAAQRSLKVIDVLPLGGKQKLAVVRCYDRTFLIGVGEKEVSPVAELDAAIGPERETPPTRADLHSFAQVLDRMRKPKRTPVTSAEGILG